MHAVSRGEYDQARQTVVSNAGGWHKDAINIATPIFNLQWLSCFNTACKGYTSVFLAPGKSVMNVAF